MKLPEWLMNILITFILPQAKIMGIENLVKWANSLKAENEDYYRTTIIALYRFLKVHIQPIAGRTDNNWDDQAVDLVVAAIERSATENTVPLPDATIKNPALPNP